MQHQQREDDNNSIEEDFIHHHSDDAYVEDDLLPDLVLDTTLRKESTSSLEGHLNENDGSNSSSVIDLLMSLNHGRRSVSEEGNVLNNMYQSIALLIIWISKIDKSLVCTIFF